MKKYSKIISVLLIIAVLLSGVNAASAYDRNTPKEEVIYANLGADGTVEKLYAVNIFDMDEAGKITDYGKYSSVRNLSSSSHISQSGDTVTIDAEAGKLYYEGIMDSDKALPWKIKISYYLDGSHVQPGDLAGADGRLQIIMDITENSKCKGNFFDSCGLQISVTLDTELCSNIKADGATAANVGSERQLSYLIMPGNSRQIQIEADVEDFELDEIIINGLPLGMEIDLNADENEEISSKLEGLKDGARQIDEGAGDILDGSKKLKDSSSKLSKGLGTLTQQNENLIGGAYSVFSQLAASAQNQLNSGISAMGMSVELTPENYGEVLDGLMAQLPDGHPAKESLSESVSSIRAQLDSYKIFYDGLCQYTEGVKTAASGSKKLAEGAGELYDGASDLKDGTQDLHRETADIDAELEEEINKAIDDMMGKNFKVHSFVSSKNSEVSSVQFIMKTAAVKKEEIKVEKQEEDETSFLDKLMALFKK